MFPALMAYGYKCAHMKIKERILLFLATTCSLEHEPFGVPQNISGSSQGVVHK